MTADHPHYLPINQLQPNPLQPRGKIMKDQLDELVDSIKSYGVLEPIIVAHTPAGYQIIAGERRWRAAQLAGLKEVPVLVKVTTPRGMLEMVLIENVQRVDLSPLERAQAFLQLGRDFKFSVSQIGEKIGKSSAYVSNTLRLLQLPDALKDGLTGGQISEGHARALASIDDERAMIELYKRVLRDNLSVRATEEAVRKAKHLIGEKPRTKARHTLLQSPDIDRWEKSIQDFFHSPSKVRLAQSSRQTKIIVVLNGTPRQTRDELEKLYKLFNKKSKPEA